MLESLQKCANNLNELGKQFQNETHIGSYSLSEQTVHSHKFVFFLFFITDCLLDY